MYKQIQNIILKTKILKRIMTLGVIVFAITVKVINQSNINLSQSGSSRLSYLFLKD